jgi:hypothetical protein
MYLCSDSMSIIEKTERLKTHKTEYLNESYNVFIIDRSMKSDYTEHIIKLTLSFILLQPNV